MANIIVAKAVAYFLCNDAGSILLVRERSSAITKDTTNDMMKHMM